MNLQELLSKYRHSAEIQQLQAALSKNSSKLHLPFFKGSSTALYAAAYFEAFAGHHVFVCNDLEEARFFYDDLSSFLPDQRILYFPGPFKKTLAFDRPDQHHKQQRTETLDRLKTTSRKGEMVVSCADALAEKVLPAQRLRDHTLELKVGEPLDLDFILEFLTEYGFERVDFVYQPGELAIRGGIIDLYSYSSQRPYRIELGEDHIESIRSFDPESQLSEKRLQKVAIIPNLEENEEAPERINFLEYITPQTVLWTWDVRFMLERIRQYREGALEYEAQHAEEPEPALRDAQDRFETADRLESLLKKFRVIELSSVAYFHETAEAPALDILPQQAFNKNFELVAEAFSQNSRAGWTNLVFSDRTKQVERIYQIMEDLQKQVSFIPIYRSLQSGFIDRNQKLAFFAEAQIFDRYHLKSFKQQYNKEQSITLKELYQLKPGDFVTHIDHGVGRFGGLDTIEVNGKMQEAIRLVYKDNDILYVNVHSLHKISRYAGKEGTAPKLNKLGSNAWEKVKNRTKKKVKDIARDLIKVYAQRKAAVGFEFAPDNYLQTELEASFIYEDTPDQALATDAVKQDMEAEAPMDRLVCGDVGFGKTEVAIRAAFKATQSAKQVAVLVPTTVLALQHYKSFGSRLGDFDITVDYISRFRSARQVRETLGRLERGDVDIVIGTHKLLSKEVRFADLGLLIIDEEQKFGVAAKEKIKQFKAHVDTLTLTATPIPRTLQFSLMGARDLSVINTPPPNRQPIDTTVTQSSDELIKEAVETEISRGGQVFFIHNRVKDIGAIAEKVRTLVPQCKVAVAHGQMEGRHLEEVMLNFVEGAYDVLVSTSIIESGLDITNANTLIVNQAQNFGLSDLHQMRGRVGRSNRKAYAYLLVPPKSVIPADAKRRLAALEEFSDLGSGFKIAMRDLDIRGAGNILGAEQSGFIADIGIEMYHKILDEAVQELKEDEFPDLVEDAQKGMPGTRECQIDTDLEIRIPEDYVSNIEERLTLYRKLEELYNEEDVSSFLEMLRDRFGPVPKPAVELMDAVRMKWVALQLGLNRLIMKNGRMRAYFAAKPEAPFYQSDRFGKILQFVQLYDDRCRLDQKGQQLTIVMKPVEDVRDALGLLQEMERMVEKHHDVATSS